MTTEPASPGAILLYEFCGTALVTYSYGLLNGENFRAYAYFIGFIIAFNISGA
jgi:hypothetical protein